MRNELYIEQGKKVTDALEEVIGDTAGIVHEIRELYQNVKLPVDKKQQKQADKLYVTLEFMLSDYKMPSVDEDPEIFDKEYGKRKKIRNSIEYLWSYFFLEDYLSSKI